MGRITVTEETYIRQLPFSAVQKLQMILDPGKLWEKFAVNIPKKIGIEFEPKYSYISIEQFSKIGRTSDGSPTRAILSDWGMQNVKVKDLISVLSESKLYAAADYLSVSLMEGKPVERKASDSEAERDEENINQDCKTKPDKTEQQKVETQLLRSATAAAADFPGAIGSGNDLSYASGGCPSGNLNAGFKNSGPTESDEIEEEEHALKSLLSVKEICLQHMNYNLLKTITGDFNEKELLFGGNLIGRGGFGTVYLGQFHNGFQIAVKCLKDDNEDMRKQFETELQVLSKYRHENIVHLLGSSKDGLQHCLIYQYMQNGSLEDRLCCKNDTTPLSCLLRIKIVKGTARGIAYLNGQGLVHRDIKSANVLLDKDFVPKVGDFATARMAPSGNSSTFKNTSVLIGTSAYLAPEAFQFDVSAKLDSYSFGVVLLELITGLPPFDNDREEKDLWSHIDENCDEIMDMVDQTAAPWNKQNIDTLYRIARNCLEHKKKKRPLVEHILPELEELS
ncbi:interleukin-1 receptor-associated kinase 4-like [Gigantopelta aegis]|uniref:interleukin-1 receptor-associated kinase 4-like n=1 Tax=Gigantopelta aegis TaxID=1735272 RepID=UPI001B88C7D3|nr:interleukin-1 receptor-associated kinase 4-like [Gigantopelta aegis]